MVAAPTVVCLGLATLDVVHRADDLPRPGAKGWATATELAAGGPAANAAVTAARLLGSAVLVTALGADAAGDAVRAELGARSVAVVDLGPVPATPVASCVVTPDGERTVVSPGARTSTVELDDAALAVLERADVLLVDGHHPLAAGRALDVAGGLRVLDAGSAKPHAEAWLSRLDVVAGSADYAAGLGLDLDAALAHVLAGGAGAAVMTDGARPVRWAAAEGARVAMGGGTRSGEQPAPAVEAVDTLGAGDAFHGALAAALALGAHLPDAVERAVAVASTRVQEAGARAWLADVEPWV